MEKVGPEVCEADGREGGDGAGFWELWVGVVVGDGVDGKVMGWVSEGGGPGDVRGVGWDSGGGGPGEGVGIGGLEGVGVGSRGVDADGAGG